MPQRNTTGHFLRPANAVTTGNVLEYDAVQIVGTCQLVGFKPSSLYDILGSILLQKTGFKNGLHPLPPPSQTVAPTATTPSTATLLDGPSYRRHRSHTSMDGFGAKEPTRARLSLGDTVAHYEASAEMA
ncbi:hypothetical protein J3459_009683 [Metarhizium acridum]|nr:hypothetical protein J3459_009683 [Metarhizium acridum]